MIRWHGKKLFALLMFAFGCLGVYHLVFVRSMTDVRSKTILSPFHLACQHPKLDINSPEISHFFHKVDPILCDLEEDWVTVIGAEAIISQEAIDRHDGEIECSFTGKLNTCSTVRWQSTLAGIRRDSNIHSTVGWDKVASDSLNVSVFVLGLDSLSRNTFIRSLPKTYRFLVKDLGAIVLEGYNIIGDGTPQALIPMLTGKIELELPEARSRMGDKANFVDIYPLIFSDFQSSGYATLFAEDQPHIGTFNYRLKGFDEPPTTHYMRPFYVHTYPQYGGNRPYCLAGTPRHMVFLNYLQNFLKVYKDKPKFAFAFHAELSHDDYNLISSADEDFVNFLNSSRTLLQDTIFFLISDHGHRFTEIRNSQQGKQEERLPFFSVVLPQKLRNNLPSLEKHLRKNIHRLSTPFDVHATLQDVIHFSETKKYTANRGISLFHEIPKSRTCVDAFIEIHWCACLAWYPVTTTDVRVVEASNFLVQQINKLTFLQRNLCHMLALKKISWAGKLLPNQGLLSFKNNIDLDGWVPDMSGQTAVSEEVYEVHIVTSPGSANFEAAVTYNLKAKAFSVQIEDVSRTNKYGNQSSCLMSTHHHLIKFCYCVT